MPRLLHDWKWAKKTPRPADEMYVSFWQLIKSDFISISIALSSALSAFADELASNSPQSETSIIPFVHEVDTSNCFIDLYV